MKRTCSTLALLATTSIVPAQHLLLPDDAHLTESNVVSAANGSAAFFCNTGGRFQVLYEASHFVGTAGVSGPIVITRIRFRGEDSESNFGGQIFSGVTIQLGSTALTATGMSTTFASNRATATTTLGPLGTTNVTMLPSLGTVPNNACVDIDLTAIGASFVYDPTSPTRCNLLLDITLPATPSPASNLVPIQDTSGTVATIRGRAVSTSAPASTAGTAQNPPVLSLEFTGQGGHVELIPARNESYGAACGGSPSSFYQLFPFSAAFDLAPGGLTLTPDQVASPAVYAVHAGAGAVDLSQLNATPDSTLDEGLVAHALGFLFHFPGGSTTTIRASTNGFLWLDATMMSADFSPTVLEFLGNTASAPCGARLAPFWHDFHAGRNTVTHANSGLHCKTDTAAGPGHAICYVTWFQLGNFNTGTGGGHSVNTMQCVLDQATGRVEFRYGAMSVLTGGASSLLVNGITGFSRGRIGAVNSVDPQSRDLSLEVPFVTKVEGAASNLGLVAAATPVAGGAVYGGRAFPGQHLTWNANNVPPGSLLGAQLLDVAATRPGFQLPPITAPGCRVSTSLDAVVWQTFLFPGASILGTVPLIVPPGLAGCELFAQFVVLDGLIAGPDLVTAASNAIVHTFGLN